MTITLNQIPIDLRTPGTYVEIDASRARKGLAQRTPRVLLIGNRQGAAAGAAGALQRLFSPAEIGPRLGARSVLAQMAAAFMVANTSAEVWALPLADDAGGVAATFTVTFTAAATAAGRMAFYIAGRRVTFAVAAGDAVATLASGLSAAVTAHPDLPVTAAAALGVVTLTARNKGTQGNAIDVRANFNRDDATPAGVAFTIAAGVAGATDPSVTAAIAAMGDEPFDAIVVPWTSATNRAALVAELVSRWGPQRALDGLLFQAMVGSQGALASAGAALNSQVETILGFRAPLQPVWEIAATYAAVVLRYGAEDPARPFQTLPLPGITAPAPSDRFSRAERELLLRDGISTWTADADGQVILERPITTYQTDAGGAEDPAYYDLNTLLTVSYLRWSLRHRFAVKFPRFKLGNDGTNYAPGQPIVTPKVARAELIAWALDLEAAGLVENVAQFKADLQVERDASDQNRLNAIVPPDLINQFRVLAAQIQFRL
ncbi:phage tail sheath subtilisin-like domain-containing protein [Brevundimonas vitis]|uniref:Phage tail sheath subtilisin-like domain-containing protein n=1 Tax=Brevundimonas vitisensis TaxID=2800818 RepID=A0ABX7BR08_9CAUL|nr:phage tail sheath subtilisin-like domain-containing protein [Brevundimonas vitisensis]QQQ19671.1 phage tail sheath subtilisin-like domain-containing protein [Brevundimonas vitisensis]